MTLLLAAQSFHTIQFVGWCVLVFPPVTTHTHAHIQRKHTQNPPASERREGSHQAPSCRSRPGGCRQRIITPQITTPAEGAKPWHYYYYSYTDNYNCYYNNNNNNIIITTTTTTTTTPAHTGPDGPTRAHGPTQAHGLNGPTGPDQKWTRPENSVMFSQPLDTGKFLLSSPFVCGSTAINLHCYNC